MNKVFAEEEEFQLEDVPLDNDEEMNGGKKEETNEVGTKEDPISPRKASSSYDRSTFVFVFCRAACRFNDTKFQFSSFSSHAWTYLGRSL